MVAFADLLESGYFPRELPPVFTTVSFAQHMAGWIPATKPPAASHLMPFSLGRVGGLRRRLMIPNPQAFANLAFHMAANWPAIGGHLAGNRLSFTSPTPGKSAGRALDPRFRLEALPVRRAITRAGSRYLVIADVARFYSSIYTHTIPWAAHTKPIAKHQKNNLNLYGNLLDQCVRKCQDDQTIGIPIGPDTSLVIGELLLSKVDAQLRGLASPENAFRYIDDYEISCRSLRQAEETLVALDDALRSFELELNHKKSRIIELPTALYDTWRDPLSKFIFAAKSPAEDREEIVRYFTNAFDLRTRNPEAYVLNYALSRLPVSESRPSSWRLIESLVLQCLALEQGSTRYVMAVLLEAHAAGRRLNRDRIAEALSRHLEEHTHFGHTAEIAWILWGATELGLPLSAEAASAVSKMEDAFVALLTIRARGNGVFPRGVRTSKWRPYMCAQELYGPLWLLSYEANVQGWLPNAGGVDFVAADPFFGPLKQKGVSFLNLDPEQTLPRIRLGVRGAAQAFYP